jgi:hypothetical protein
MERKMPRKIATIPFALMFVLNSAYAGITWLGDTITATNLPVGQWVNLNGVSGVKPRT